MVSLKIGIFMYKHWNNMLPSVFISFFRFNTDVHDRNTRQSNNYYIEFARTTLYQSTIKFSGPLLFNALPSSLKQQKSIKSFKNNYFKALIEEVA